MTTSRQSILFDAQGPRARRVSLVANLVGAALVLGVAAWLLGILADRGQLAPELWTSLFSSSVWLNFVLPGLQNTFRAAAFATVGALVFGIVFGLGRLSHAPVVRWLSGVVVEFFRAVPVLLMMIFVWLLLGFNAQETVSEPEFVAVVVALVLYNGAVIAELVRSGVGSLPKGQGEAGLAVGLTRGQTLRSIQLPQALIAMLPALVSQMVVVLKDSALGQIITYSELLRSMQLVGTALSNPLQALTLAAAIFIVINFALTWLAQWLSRFLSSRTSGRTEAGPGIGVAGAAGAGATIGADGD